MVLNVGGKHLNILGENQRYNPLAAIIADNFKEPGRLQYVTSLCAELAKQLYPDEVNSNSSNGNYWSGGSQDYIAFAIQQCVLVDGDTASLGDVCLLLNDRERLLKETLWVAGKLTNKDGEPLPPMPLEQAPWASGVHDPEDVKNYIGHYRTFASSIADLLNPNSSKSSEAGSFLRGAQQALLPFNKTTYAHKVLSGKSSVFFREMKESATPITATIVIDDTQLETQKKIAALLQWCAITEFKRSTGKHPVYLICDETSNF